MSFKSYKGVIALFGVAISLLISATTLSLFIDKNILSNSKDVVRVTKFSSFAYGVFWFEPRLRRFQSHSYPIYPEMPPADRLNFIYSLKREIKYAK
jgi:hypothetical protein